MVRTEWDSLEKELHSGTGLEALDSLCNQVQAHHEVPKPILQVESGESFLKCPPAGASGPLALDVPR